MKMSNDLEKTTFRSAWKKFEVKKKLPSRLRNLVIIDSQEFEENVLKEESKFVNEFVNSIAEGDCFIIKKFFSEEFMKKLKNETWEYFKSKPSTFYKMNEYCPNFHRVIDKETGKKYSFQVCKHSFYYFPWNESPQNIYEPINEKWRLIKKAMGLKMTQYEKNTPKDRIVDRIQVVQYHSRDAFLETHTDPYEFQRFFISGYMSKKGKDYEGGGFYILDKNDKKVDAEKHIDVGDLGIGYATVAHGVDPVNLDKIPDSNDKNDGRWFLGLYSNQSDEVKNRHTGKPL